MSGRRSPNSYTRLLVVAFTMAWAWRSAGAGPPPVVTVAVKGTPPEVAAFSRAVASWLTGQDVSVSFESVESIDGSALLARSSVARAGISAQAWVDLDAPAGATLYLVDASHERLLVRRHPAGAPRDVSRETLARALATAVEALLAGGQIGVARERILSSPGLEVRRPLIFDLRLGGFWEAQAFAPTVMVAHGPGLKMGATVGRERFGVDVEFAVQKRLSHGVAPHPVGVDLSTTSFRALAGLRHTLSDRACLRWQAGGGIDLVRVKPSAADQSAWTTMDVQRTTPVLRMQAAFEYRLMGWLAMGAAVGVEVDPSRTRYVSEEPLGHHVLVAPRLLRPLILISLGVSPSGAPQ